MKIKSYIPAIFLCLLGMAVRGAGAADPAIIPLPQRVTVEAGDFALTPGAGIYTDSASGPTAKFLRDRLRPSTGYPLPIRAELPGTVVRDGILLTTQSADLKLGAEGYELTVTSNSVVIRAPSQAGVFYGVQTLLQLLPPEVFSTNRLSRASWLVPCVRIEDWPRFRWRGLMLDVSRHFFNKMEIETLLDAMAMEKLNTFHWHLTDDQGWRIEIPQYPRLTQVGAWRSGVGFGFGPASTTAYGSDGRYGGFYTLADIREVVAYAAARHITVVPEIEMPGHSTAALAAYPQLSCTGGPFAIPLRGGVFNGIYDPANEATFQFLEAVLREVFGLFPGQYVHIGGDEVRKETWEKSAACQELMRREGLSDEKQLQGWFMKRMEKFIAAQGRIPIGWSEILQGGIATNTAVMDWIGGATEAASQGHDVVMASQESCYLCYYPSLDRPPDLITYRPYLPVSKVYAFEPIPETLEAQYQPHILGVEACVWTPDIPSMSVVEELAFPRLDALAEIGWSSKSTRNFYDFSRRLEPEYQRLALCGITFWKDDATQIGQWEPAQITGRTNPLAWDATERITAPGRYRLSLDYVGGRNGLEIQWAALLENGKEIARDAHAGFTGTALSAMKARDWNYFFDLPAFSEGARYTIQVSAIGKEGNDSKGVVFLGKETSK